MDKTPRIRMNREERRLQILDCALEEFVRKGYNGATTQDIAKAANISEVTLFRYFDTKKEIFQQAVEPILITTMKRSIVEAKELESMEKLKYILTKRIKLLAKYHRVIKLILMESQVNPEIANFNYIEKTSSLLEETMVDAGLEIKNKGFILRVLMGSILSFLYLPESDDKRITLFVNDLIKKIIN